VEKLRKA